MNKPTEVTFQQLLALRRQHNCMLISDTEGALPRVRITAPNGEFLAYPSGETDLGHLAALASVVNLPIAEDEFRFTTHDFTNPASWDGRTNGDPSATWAAANGGVAYDDVLYRWLDSNGDPVCYLSGPSANDPPAKDGVGNVWRDSGDDSVIAQYNSQTSHWERTDTNANVTSSRWSIIPYPNTKMEVITANALWGADSVVNGTLRYTVHMYLSAAQAQAATGNQNATAGVYPVKEFAYPDADLLRMSADTRAYIGQDVEACYDYRTTVLPVIDSLTQMRLELTLDNHAPVTSATSRKGRAVFIGKKIASF